MGREIKHKPKTYLWLCEGAAFCGGRPDTTSFESESSMHMTSLTSSSCWESGRSTGGPITNGWVTGVMSGGVSLTKMIKIIFWIFWIITYKKYQ